jgi:hypothetical protein
MDMVKVTVSGSLDIHKIHRLVRSDEILVGYPDDVEHPAGEYLRHTVSKKTGKKLKRMERAASKGKAIQNSDLAEMLHDGTATIPARPFLMQALAEEKDVIKKALSAYFQERAKGKEGNLGKIGALAVGAIQRYVRGDYYRNTIPNAKGTIRRKGSDKPLIDTSFLINSTTFVVHNRQKMPDQRGKVTITESGTIVQPSAKIPTAVKP